MSQSHTAAASLSFLRRFYPIILVVCAVVGFFVIYNVYLVDRSLSNLKGALEKLNNAKTISEARKLSSLLESALMEEISSTELQAARLSKLELAKDLLDKSDSIKQLDDVKFALQELVSQKEKKRVPLLKALDNLNKVFVSDSNKGPVVQKLAEQEKFLRARLDAVQGAEERQNVLLDLGNIYTQMGRLEDANESYVKCSEAVPGSKTGERALFSLAFNERKMGKSNDALARFEWLSKNAKDSQIASLSQYQVAQTYRQQGQHDKAVEIYQAIEAKNDVGMAEVAGLQAGNTYLYDMKDYKKAQEVFNKTRESLRGTQAAQYIEDSSYSKIAQQYRKDGFLLLRQGYEVSSAIKFKEANECFNKALEADPKDGMSFTGKALAYLWMNDPDRAMDAARRAVKLMPNDEVASVNLGYIYLQMGLVDEAVVEYKRFIAANPFTARTYYNLGYALVLAGRIDEAQEAFQQAVKIDPGFVYAYNNLGWCMWQFNQYAKAIEAFETAVRVKPDFVDAQYNLGMIYKAIGKLEEAKVKFETVLDKSPQYGSAKRHLEETLQLLYKQ